MRAATRYNLMQLGLEALGVAVAIFKLTSESTRVYVAMRVANAFRHAWTNNNWWVVCAR